MTSLKARLLPVRLLFFILLVATLVIYLITVSIRVVSPSNFFMFKFPPDAFTSFTWLIMLLVVFSIYVLTDDFEKRLGPSFALSQSLYDSFWKTRRGGGLR